MERTRRCFVMIAMALAATLMLSVLARAATPGTIDTGFGNGGVARVGSDTRLLGTAIQSDGKVVAVGESGGKTSANLLLVRFTTTGALDSSFGSGGIVRGPAVPNSMGSTSLGRAIAVQPDGKIVVVGKATDSSGSSRGGLLIERYNPDGRLDGTFGAGGVVNLLSNFFGDGYAVAVQSDGKIIATGSEDAAGSDGVAPRVAVVRLTSAGRLDQGFGSGGIEILDLGPYSYALAVALQSDGKIVIAGSQAPGLQATNALLARLTSTGSLDHSFNGSGAFANQYAQGAASSAFNSVAVQRDGKIVAAGGATHGNTGTDTIVARFTSAGAQDSSFGSGGVVHTPSGVNVFADSSAVPGANAIAIASNGDILAAATIANGLSRTGAISAYTANGALDSRFGSNGTAMVPSGTSSTEGDGIAITPSGQAVVVGDSHPTVGGFTLGLAVRFNAFVPPPPPPPPPPPALKVTLKGLARNAKSSTVAKKGLKFRVSCNRECSVKVRLTVSSSAAKKLHLKVHGRKPVTIAVGRASLKRGSTTTITLKLSKRLGRELVKQKSVGASLQVSVTSAATHKSQTINRRLTFER